MQGTKYLSGCALALLVATMILAGCSVGDTTSAPSSPATVTTQPSATPTSTQPSATPTATPQGDWQTYTDATYGFRLEVPAILFLTTSPSSDVAFHLTWSYIYSNPSPDQALFAETSVSIYMTDTLTGGTPNPCTRGTPLTIGSGVTAYEDDSLDNPNPAPGGGAHGLGGLDVNFVAGGVYFRIELDGNPPKDTFRTRYGSIWQHILNSFVPGPSDPNGHPCG